MALGNKIMTQTSSKPATAPAPQNRSAAASERHAAVAAPFDPARQTEMYLTRLMYSWFQEVWCKGNLDAISEIMNHDAVISGSVSALADPGCDYGEVVAAIRNLLGPIKVTFSHAMETQDWVCVLLLAETSNSRNGEPFQFTGQVMARVEDGRIAEMHSNMDYFRMFEQLEQLPPEALAICLTGERLR